MRLVLASDDESALVAALTDHLETAGHVVRRVAVGASWTDVGRLVAEAVALGSAEFGIACCWTGTGVSIAANKIRGVRAALCTDAETAAGARRWNDANVLALSLRLTTAALGSEILDAFLATGVEPGELERIAALETDPEPVPTAHRT